MAGFINSIFKNFTPRQTGSSAADHSSTDYRKSGRGMNQIGRSSEDADIKLPRKEDSRITEVTDLDHVSDRMEEFRLRARVIQAAAQKQESAAADAANSRSQEPENIPAAQSGLNGSRESILPDTETDEDPETAKAQAEEVLEIVEEISSMDAEVPAVSPEEEIKPAEENAKPEEEEINHSKAKDQPEQGPSPEEIASAAKDQPEQGPSPEENASGENASGENASGEKDQPFFDEEDSASDTESGVEFNLIESVEKAVNQQNQMLVEKMDNHAAEMTRQMSAALHKAAELEERIQVLERELAGQKEEAARSLEEVKAARQQLQAALADAAKESNAAADKTAGELQAAIKASEDQLAENLKDIRCEQLFVKSELSDKIHTETVKSFGNTKELFKENAQKQDELMSAVHQLSDMKKLILPAIVLGVVNAAGILVLILHAFGIF